MIPTIYTHLIAAGSALAIGASCAAYVQAQRYGLQIETLKHKATTEELVGERQAVKDMASFQKGLNDALANFQATGKRNAAAQQDLDRSLRDLRGTTAGLRVDFADLPARLERASSAARAEYVTACTAAFEDLAAAGGRLAEGGAAIARQAEGHAADARLMQQAWPKKPSQPAAGATESKP